MPNISMPNGDVVAFPDDMPREQIKGMIATKFPDAAKMSAPSPKTDMFDTVSDQALQGATFGLGNRAQAGLAALVASGINGKPISENYENARNVGTQRLQDEFKQHPVISTASNIGGALATGGLASGTKAGAAVTDWLGSGSLAARVGKGAVAGATSGAAYGAGTAPYDKSLEGAKSGAISGALVGGAIPVVTAGLGAVKNAILPTVSEDVKPLAEKALDYGIPLSRSQVGDSRFAKTLSSTANEIPLSGSQKFYQQQSSSFNRAIAKTFGEDADKITPEVIDNAYNNIGAKYDSILAGKQVPITQKTINTLNSIQNEADSYITPDHAKIVSNAIDKIVGAQAGGGGTIAGEKLGSLRSQITSVLKTTRNDASPYLSKIRDAVIDMSTNAAPELRQANAQYRALKTIEPLAVKATESGGNISPALLQARVAQSYRDYARGGGGDLGDLARIGQRFLKETVPNSGTARRLAAYGALVEAPAAVGALAAGNPAIAAAGLAPIAAARGFNVLNNSQGLVRSAIENAGSPTVGSALSIPAGAATGLIKGHSAMQQEMPQIAPQVDPTALSPQSNAAPQTPDLFSRVTQQESGGKQFNAKGNPLISNKGAVGISQIMPGTAYDAAMAAGLPYDPRRIYTDPQYNAALGKAYLGKMQEKYGDDTTALIAYNWGPGNTDRWLKAGGDFSKLPQETKNYIKRILG